MEGIRFVTDDKGRKVAVMIDLDRHGELWEDFFDALVSRERAHEKRESWDVVKKRLTRAGKLRG
jgi:hypothetical protein